MMSHSQVSAAIYSAVLIIGCLTLVPIQARAAVEAPVAPQEVTLADKGHGWMITDSQGMTLYTSKRDIEPGKSSCVDACATTWPP